MNYVTEIQKVIDEGLNEEITIALYRLLTHRLHEVCGGVGVDEFRQRVADLHKNDLRYFREIIGGICSECPLPVEMNWRKLKYDPKRIQWCEICGSFFYDISRNGRAKSCEGDCRAEYNRRKQIGGDILAPDYKRKVEIVYVDMSPSEGDTQGHALLNRMEMQRWGAYRAGTDMYNRSKVSRKHDSERMAVRGEFIKEQPVIKYHVSELPEDSRLRVSPNFPHHLTEPTIKIKTIKNIYKLGENYVNRTVVR